MLLSLRTVAMVAVVMSAFLAGCVGAPDGSPTTDVGPSAPPASAPADADGPGDPDDPDPEPEANSTDEATQRPVETTTSEATIAYLVAYQHGDTNHSDGLYLGGRVVLPASTFEVEVSMTWTAATTAQWRVCLPYFTAPDAALVVMEGTTGCWIGSDGVSFKARFFDKETQGDTTSMLTVFVHDAPTADAAAMADARWTVTAYHYG